MSCYGRRAALGREGVLYVEYNVNRSQSQFICGLSVYTHFISTISWHSCLDTAATSPSQAPRATPCTSQHNGPLMFPSHPVLSKQFKHDKIPSPTKTFKSQFNIQIVFSLSSPFRSQLIYCSQSNILSLIIITVWQFGCLDSYHHIKEDFMQIPDILYAW